MLQVNAYVMLMTDTYPRWGSGVGAPAPAPVPGLPAAPARPLTYLRNRLVVLSASSLPPVWHVGQ